MATVTVGRTAGVLAGAEIGLLVLFGNKGLGCKVGAGVSPVAKGLTLGAAASAKEVLLVFAELYSLGFVIGDDRFAHHSS
jgi:hypothetical protein